MILRLKILRSELKYGNILLTGTYRFDVFGTLKLQAV